jgi:hypothetical protein
MPVSYKNCNDWKEMPPIQRIAGYELIQDGYWNHLLRKRAHHVLESKSLYKLYLPLLLSKLDQQGPQLLDLLIQEKAVGIKWPIQRMSFLRIDRILAYFSSLNALKLTAKKVLEILPEHHFDDVPFTLQISDIKTLSYGVDPPGATEKMISWRSEICKIAADHIRSKPLTESPKFTLEGILNGFNKKHTYEIH